MKKWEIALAFGLAVTLLWSAASVQLQVNWWGVVYPDLCLTACTEWAGEEDGQAALVTEDGPRYVLKFRAVELWQTIRQKLGK